MEIVNVKISELKFAEYNPRVMSEEEFNNLLYSIKTYGLVEPVVVNRKNNEIIGGHMRVRACINLGWETIPVIYVDLDDVNAKKLNLALNKISGDWDYDKLTTLISELQKITSIEEIGFSEHELELLLASEDRVFNNNMEEIQNQLEKNEMSNNTIVIEVEPEKKREILDKFLDILNDGGYKFILRR